jgi:uncharacterized protein (TIGR02646 family)
MHKLDRSPLPEPTCLAGYRSSRHIWDDVSTAHKREIRDSLARMQGGSRCAYCEGRIHNEGQIDHFRRRRDHPHLTFEWENLFLSCGSRQHCGHYKDRPGAPAYDPDGLLKPDVDDPDEYLYFHSNGEIRVRSGIAPEQARRAGETVRVLHLDHGALIASRRRAAGWYLRRNPDILAALAELSDEERQLYIELEIQATRTEPHWTVIRHLFERVA